jgi:hypothetical protein
MKKLLTTITLLCFSVVADAQDQYLYSPAGCTYSVSFPAQPELTTLYADNVGEWEQANYFNNAESFFTRAECIPIELDTSILRQSAISYAQDNGLEKPEYEFGNDSLGAFAKIRGFKTIDGIAGTFRIYMYFDEGSYISLYAGGPSSSYPQSGISNFFSSLKKTQ